MAVLTIDGPSLTDRWPKYPKGSYMPWGQVSLQGVPEHVYGQEPRLPAASGQWRWRPTMLIDHQDDFWGRCQMQSDYSCGTDVTTGEWRFDHGTQFTLWAIKPDNRLAMYLSGILPLKIAKGHRGIGYLIAGDTRVPDKNGGSMRLETKGTNVKIRWTVHSTDDYFIWYPNG